VPAGTIITPDELYEPATARLAPGQREPWSLALDRNPDERVDLRHVPGPEVHSHDDVYLTDFVQGYVAVTNLRKPASRTEIPPHLLCHPERSRRVSVLAKGDHSLRALDKSYKIAYHSHARG